MKKKDKKLIQPTCKSSSKNSFCAFVVYFQRKATLGKRFYFPSVVRSIDIVQESKIRKKHPILNQFIIRRGILGVNSLGFVLFVCRNFGNRAALTSNANSILEAVILRHSHFANTVVLTMNVERTIWNIFTYATLHGNPRDPSKLTSIGLQKLCRECRLYDLCLVDKPITQSAVHLIFTQEAKRASERIDPKLLDRKVVERVDFDGFLSCLMRLASICYPDSRNGDEAMLHLLMDNVLPLASRRQYISVQPILESAAVGALYSFFEEALQAVFYFYAANAANSVGAKNMTKTTAKSVHKSFDDHQQEIDAIAKASETSTKPKSGTTVGYEEFLRFSVDFGLTSSLGLTTLDVGDVYLSVCTHSDNRIQHIKFVDFWESLVRCALRAFHSYSSLPAAIKIKCMLLYMWRHIQASIREQMQGENNNGDLSSYKGGLIRGTQLLNERFLSMWAKDNYRDYLNSNTGTQSSFMSSGANSSMLLDTMTSGSETATPARTSSAAAAVDDENVTDGRAATARGLQRILIDVHDDDDLGDDRIDPALLRQLLQERQDLAHLLYGCAADAGLIQTEALDESKELGSTDEPDMETTED